MEKPIIFFDGVCGLCNGFIDFIMKIDKQKKYYFSPLQSEHAQQNLPLEMTKNLTSIIVTLDGKTYSKSEAVIMVLNSLGGPWKLFNLGKYLPENLRNKFYDLVAKNRYSMFGKKDTCRLPTPEERSRFIL